MLYISFHLVNKVLGLVYFVKNQGDLDLLLSDGSFTEQGYSCVNVHIGKSPVNFEFKINTHNLLLILRSIINSRGGINL